MGLYGRVSVAGGAQGCRGGFCEKITGAAPMPNRTIPASSNRDLPLATAEPISDAGNASVTTYLSRGKNGAQQL